MSKAEGQDEHEGALVYVASWAPQDPRDKLYDDDASGREKIGSFVRIAGAYHPVLNIFILLFDFIKGLGIAGVFFVLVILPAFIAAFMLLR